MADDWLWQHFFRVTNATIVRDTSTFNIVCQAWSIFINQSKSFCPSYIHIIVLETKDEIHILKTDFPPEASVTKKMHQIDHCICTFGYDNTFCGNKYKHCQRCTHFQYCLHGMLSIHRSIQILLSSYNPTYISLPYN